MSAARPAAAAAAIVLGCFLVFNANGREIGTYDSQASKLLAIEIATRHSLSLNHVVGRTPALAERPAFAQDRNGNFRSGYPLPSALAAGAVAWMLARVHLVSLDAPLAPALVAKLTASALSALAAGFAFAAAARRTTGARAALVAVAFAFGTSVWASASQTLWQQESSLPAMMLGILLLDETTPPIGQLALSGLLLAIAGWARPQVAPAVAVLAISAVVRFRARGLAAWIPLAAVAAGVGLLNLAWFGSALGAVVSRESLHPIVHGVPGAITLRPWTAAAGLLISPSRGLLIFSPVVAFALAGVPPSARAGSRSSLSWCLGAAAAEMAAYSFYSVWWGGHTFGPRYMLDLLPPLVPVAAAGVDAIVSRPVLAWLGAGALAWSIAVAALGAFVYPADAWNTNPSDVDRDHARLWDWRDSQIARSARTGWNPGNFAFLQPGALSPPSKAP